MTRTVCTTYVERTTRVTTAHERGTFTRRDVTRITATRAGRALFTVTNQRKAPQ